MWTALHLAAITAVIHFAQGRLAVQEWDHTGRLDGEHGYHVPKTLDNVPISGQRIQKQIEIPSIVTRNSTAKRRGQIPAISDRGRPGNVGHSAAVEKPQDHGPIQKRSLHDAPFSRTTQYRRRPLPVKLKLFYKNRAKPSGAIGRGNRTTVDHRKDVDSPIVPSGRSTLWILPNTTDATPAPLDLSPPGANASNASALAAAGSAVWGVRIAILLVPIAALALVVFVRTTVSEEVTLAEILGYIGPAWILLSRPNPWQYAERHVYEERKSSATPSANMAQMAHLSASSAVGGAEQDGSGSWSPRMTISSSSESRVPCKDGCGEMRTLGPMQKLPGSPTAFGQSTVPDQVTATQTSVSVSPASTERASPGLGSEDTSKPCILGDRSNTATPQSSDDSFEWPRLPGTVTPPRWTDHSSLSETSTASSDGTVPYEAGSDTNDFTQSEADDSTSPSVHSEVEGQKSEPIVSRWLAPLAVEFRGPVRLC